MRKKAFTLIELLITVCVIGVISSLSVPKIQEWVSKYQAKKAVSSIIADFSKAKSLSSSYLSSTATTGSNINQAAMYFTSGGYRILTRSANNISNWSLGNDTTVKTVTMPNKVTIETVNGAALGSGSAVIAFTSAGKAKNNDNTLIPTQSTSCYATGSDAAMYSVIAAVVVKVAVSDSTTTYYQVSISNFGEYRVCSTNTSATSFGTDGKEVRGL